MIALGTIAAYAVVAATLLGMSHATRRWSAAQYFVAVGGLGLTLRLLWVAHSPLEPISDSKVYFDYAVGLATTGQYGAVGHPAVHWPVGYPAFLGALFKIFGASVLVGQVANAVLGTLAVLLTWAIARVLFGDPVARLAGVAMAVFPGQIFYCAVLGSESLGQVMLLGALCTSLYAIRGGGATGWAVVTGVATGAGMLVRPVVGVLVAAVPFLWIVRGARPWAVTRSTAVLVAAVCLAMCPWTIRNYTHFRTFIPIGTGGGISLWWGANPNATGGWHLTDFSEARQLEALDPLTQDREARTRALAFIKSHPLDWLILVPKKVYILFEMDESGLWWSSLGSGTRKALPRWEYAVLARVLRFYFGTIMTAAALTLIVLLARWRTRLPTLQSMCVLTIPIVLATGFYVVFHAEDRYNHVFMPLIVIVAAFGLTHGWGRLARAAQRTEP